MSDMGSTGTVNVTPEMLQSALDAVSEYREAVSGYAKDLESIVSNLIPGSFSGSAAEGFMAFYTEKVVPLTDDNIFKLLDGIDSMLNGIKSAIPDADGVDEALGEGNKSVGN